MNAAKQKISVTIAGHEFSLISSEPESHVHRAAGLVDDEIRAVREMSPMLSVQTSSVLAAANLADRLIHAEETVESLRKQIRDYIEEVTRTKNDLADTRRELNKLKKEK